MGSILSRRKPALSWLPQYRNVSCVDSIYCSPSNEPLASLRYSPTAVCKWPPAGKWGNTRWFWRGLIFIAFIAVMTMIVYACAQY